MALNFPNSPTVGQIFGSYTWDGEKWKLTAGPAGAAPSDASPLMNGTAAPGSGTDYSRFDHVHPTDTSRAAASHSHPASAITDFSEAVDDRVGSLLVAGSNITLNYNDAANTLTVSSSGGGGGGAVTGKNRITNGRFNISQVYAATTVITASYTYCSDMWLALVESGNATVHSLRTDFSGTFNTNAIIQTATAGLKFGLLQPIELANMRDLAGNVVLSALLGITSAVNLSNIKMAVLQWTGTADTITNPIAAWGAAGTNPTLSANWAYATAPANLGVTTTGARYSVSGVVSSAARNLAAMIWCDSKSATVDDILFITDVQLESGTTATAFEFRSINQELAICQRQLEVFTLSIESASAGTAVTPYAFKVTKRIAPTVTTIVAPTTLTATASFNNSTLDQVGLQLVTTAPNSYAASWGIMANARL